ncbi:DUF4365 domain-containing protein [Streptomyces sp. NPDC048664]|uniref:DUF4365 domain-containing protein n=1 Tax=Streptomyces sp. NPDC048664 TaxID=3154505 RepID=UPI00342C360B
MAHRKRRDYRHVMEEDSGALLRSALPKQWVVHEYKPDYGIDGTVEIFEPVDEQDATFETLGEHIFFQLKSIKRTNLVSKVAEARHNPLLPKRETGATSSSTHAVRFKAIAYDLEVNELLTVEAMGASVAVVLFLTPLDQQQVYVVSLTDYIDRVLDIEDPEWRSKTAKRIYIPVMNRVPTPPAMTLLRQYGKRAKLMHLFNVASYQNNELAYAIERAELSPAPGQEADLVTDLASRFCKRLLALDVWNDCGWLLLRRYHAILAGYKDLFSGDSTAIHRIGWKFHVDDVEQYAASDLLTSIRSTWQGMNSLGRTYEELVREWGLPTYLGTVGLSLDELSSEFSALVEHIRIQEG